MSKVKGTGVRWLCPSCGKVIDRPPNMVAGERYHAYRCDEPLVRCTVLLGELVAK